MTIYKTVFKGDVFIDSCHRTCGKDEIPFVLLHIFDDTNSIVLNIDKYTLGELIKLLSDTNNAL